MSATLTVGGRVVASFECPEGEAVQPSEQCAWLRDRVNDALTAELAKQQEGKKEVAAACSSHKGSTKQQGKCCDDCCGDCQSNEEEEEE